MITEVLLTFYSSWHLTSQVTTINRFVSKLVDNFLAFFKILRKNKAFEWTNESKMAFQYLKEYLGSPLLLIIPNTTEELILYLSMLPTVVSVMLVKEEDEVQMPVYYVSKVLLEVKIKYLKSRSSLMPL